MKWALTLLVLVVLALHHDFWNWTNRGLVFGFLPVGLVYHGCYALLAATTMAILVKFAWPKHLETIEEQTLDRSGENA